MFRLCALLGDRGGEVGAFARRSGTICLFLRSVLFRSCGQDLNFVLRPLFVRQPSQFVDEMPLYNFKLKCVLLNGLNLEFQTNS